MIQKAIKLSTIIIFSIAGLGILALVIFPRFVMGSQAAESSQSRVVLPNVSNGARASDNVSERIANEDSTLAKIALRDGESLISVLTQNFDNDPQEKQIIAFNKPSEIDGPIYIAYVDYDSLTGGYRRVWEMPTSITRSSTLNLFTRDMIGDRSICLIVMGMNGNGEHILIMMKRNLALSSQSNSPRQEEPFIKIAEIRVEGSINIREQERTTAYHLGMSNGEPFTILAYNRDYGSANILDQIETTYAYNSSNGLYEQRRLVRVPGSQIEQRRVREVLSGSPGNFEKFISGLWYYVSTEGTSGKRQLIYFDPDNREIIFYGDQIQQVFTWRGSIPTRYGIYISSQNVSVVSLRRFMDIELESIESVRLKVSEDVGLKIGVSNPWNGSYRRAGTVVTQNTGEEKERTTEVYVDLTYSGSIGKLRFNSNGTYALQNSGAKQEGKYAFFILENMEFLELRPETAANINREVYKVERNNNPGYGLTLIRVRLGTRGVQELHEAAIPMSLAGE